MSTPIYLGSKISITDSNINFDNANVYGNQPTETTNAANKNYVDEVYSEINSIIQENISNSNSQISEIQTNINDVQNGINTFTEQLNNMFQYFLKRDRDVSIPRRS
jgi:hypothetical protein